MNLFRQRPRLPTGLRSQAVLCRTMAPTSRPALRSARPAMDGGSLDLAWLPALGRPLSTPAHAPADPWKSHEDIDYRQLKPISEMPSDNVLLIDVREEAEVIQGNIPSSVNIPMSKLEKLLDLHPDDFLKTLGFPKPKIDQKIIFYCRSGVRSATALEIARLKGFKSMRNYKGSWLDWVDKENIS